MRENVNPDNQSDIIKNTKPISPMKRVVLLALIMVGVCAIVMMVMTVILYRYEIEARKEMLHVTARTQARLIEAVTRFDKKYSSDYPGGSEKATMSQIIDARNQSPRFGETGELHLARHEGDFIVWQFWHRNIGNIVPNPTPFDSNLAEPMRRALSGLSGTMVGLDYRGETVIAAYEPVGESNMGIVALIDLGEVRAPFFKAGLTAAMIALFVVFIGVALFVKVSNPLIKRLENQAEFLEAEVASRTKALEEEMGRRSVVERELVDASREAGKAEVATGVLHNVGNTLNSVNVSVNLINETLDNFRFAPMKKVADLCEEQSHKKQCVECANERFRRIPEFLRALSENFEEGRAAVQEEASVLRKQVGHISKIVTLQQRNAKSSEVIENVVPREILEVALDLSSGSFGRHEIETISEVEDVPGIRTDWNKLLQILTNLISNAKDALKENEPGDRILKIHLLQNDEGGARFQVIDNGTGIAEENIDKIFQYGFTTRKDGHGFGLHSSVLAATEMGGNLTVVSEGRGKGATFTLDVPLEPPVSSASRDGEEVDSQVHFGYEQKPSEFETEAVA